MWTAGPPSAAARSADGPAAQGVKAFKQGDYPVAARLAVEALERSPFDPVALKALAGVRELEGRAGAAITLLRRAAHFDTSDYATTVKLVQMAIARGGAEAAEPHARQAVRLSPTNPQAHYLMGMTMTQLGRHALAAHHNRRALELSPRREPLILTNLATNLLETGEIETARELFREADAAQPNDRRTLLAWARLEEIDRKFDDAETLLDRVDQIARNNPQATLRRATVLGRRGRVDEAVKLLDERASAGARQLGPQELLERGRLKDRLGLHDEAWADFSAGKARALELGAGAYDEAAANRLTSNLKTYFTRERLAVLPRAEDRRDGPQPIFILGFPRSGTTLVEQTLSSSDAISAGDELPFVGQIAAISPRLLSSPWEYPGSLSDLLLGDRREGLDDLRNFYLASARRMGVARDDTPFFTDKMPLNETHLGLIALMFPRAPLVHVVRHPLDVMVSAMSNFFTHGFGCGRDLESAAKHLLMTADLVEHYRGVADLNYLELRYEDIVDDQEATVRRLFDFVGVPFDPKALEFEANERYARTASYAQVKEPLYRRSRHRHQNYLRHLAPAQKILAPLIERLGYEVEPLAA
ncbi:tetratricopeptide repeat-containing sulfotransferase family protein [Chenggangzhangella methanolivorans]|uniref:tetratricopeptide repeat-containing sulfotransferase family protein n=1 Tax=Chenggangzhangella methanolivorans TaxID=1437009 RepID=UPI0021BD6416|nr:sulfotransferase family protein [Chenggangzhangella methanolivorans]